MPAPCGQYLTKKSSRQRKMPPNQAAHDLRNRTDMHRNIDPNGQSSFKKGEVVNPERFERPTLRFVV